MSSRVLSGFEPWRRAVTAALGVALMIAFFTTFAAVYLNPVRELTENLANCAGAAQIERAGFSSGESLAGSTAATNKSMRGPNAYALRCTFPDGRVEQVSNTVAFIKAISLAFLIGFLPGFLITLGVVRLSAESRPEVSRRP